MNEPQTVEGTLAVRAIKAGGLTMWANEPSDPITGMVVDIERAAAVAERARIRAEIDEARERIDVEGEGHGEDYKTGWLDALETVVEELDRE